MTIDKARVLTDALIKAGFRLLRYRPAGFIADEDPHHLAVRMAGYAPMGLVATVVATAAADSTAPALAELMTYFQSADHDPRAGVIWFPNVTW